MEDFEKSNERKAHGKPLGDENSRISASCPRVSVPMEEHKGTKRIILLWFLHTVNMCY